MALWSAAKSAAQAAGTTVMKIRAERPADHECIEAVVAAAFETDLEARLVEELRASASPLISLVAEDDAGILGHILFSPVTLSGHPALHLMGLAPMAVLPEAQHTGIGSALVHAGLSECRQLGCGAVVVLGHPDYYPRFGFHPAARCGISCEYDVPEEAFMLLELKPGCLSGVTGKISYHPAFSMFD